MKIKRLAVVSVAVRDIDQALCQWERLGLRPAVRFHDDDEQLEIARFYLGRCALELIRPTAENAVSRFLARRGEGIFSILLEVDDPDRALGELRARGVPVTGDGPRAGLEGRYIGVHPRSLNGVLVLLWSGRLLGEDQHESP
jgi:methylmalonyl-CoA/ethylmalonyl-CoA epimerase